MLLPLFIGLFTKSYKRISMKFFEGVGYGPNEKRLDFGGDQEGSQSGSTVTGSGS